MRQLIDDHRVRLARDDRVDVHLFALDVAVFDLAAMMCFDEAQHDIHSPIAELMRLLEHSVCLAYARGGADINFESSPLRFRRKIEKSFGLESFVIAHSSPGRSAMTS